MSDGPPYQVLVVDDDETMRRLVVTFLQQAGIPTITASNGQQGLAAAREHAERIGAIVLDVMMPGMDGYQVLTALGDGEQTRDIPVLMLSAHANQDDDVIRGIKQGAVDHVAKPFRGAVLTEKIRALCARRDGQQRLKDELDAAVEKAATDALTGLANRRDFDAELARDVTFAERHKQPFTLLMVDVDHFKPINDNHGHPEGDRVLKHIADMLQGSLRDGDGAFRVGGEEFAILLRRTDCRAGAAVAERIRRAMADVEFQFLDGRSQRITLSVGLASADSTNDFVTGDILQRADRALYGAKEAGRNQVTAESELGDRHPRHQGHGH